MKKALGGCLIVGLLMLLLAAAGGWWFFIRPAWNSGSEFLGAAKHLSQLATLNTKINNQEAFNPPADGVVSPEGVKRYIAIQTHIRSLASKELDILKIRYESLRQKGEENGPIALSELASAYGDLANLLVKAKTAQVTAMNTQNMSLSEYQWIRNQALISLTMASENRALAKALPAGTERNAASFEPHREVLKSTAVMAWLGI